MNIKRIVASVLLTAVAVMSFAACSAGNVSVDKAVTVDTVHNSSSEAARGYIQSIFTEDSELFVECFSEAFRNELTAEDENQIFLSFKSSVPQGFEFLGTQFSAANEFTTANGYDEDYMRSNISMLQLVDEDDVAAMEIIKLRVYFYSEEEGKNQYTDVYVVVYAMAGQWYAFEIQSADADFKA